MTGEGLKRTPLFEAAAALGGKMVDFAGWEMALHYGSQLAEHQAVRRRSGLFDVSHMGRFVIEGTDARRLLMRLTPVKAAALAPGKAVYTVLMNERAGIIDDLLIYTLGDEKFLVVVNAGTRAKDWAWMVDVLAREGLTGGVAMADMSDEWAMVALQGPSAAAITRGLLPGAPLDDLYFYEHWWDAGAPLLLGRTGYTGEDGVEVIAPNAAILDFWNGAVERGAQPCGLGCRDSLRLEMAYALYGSDIDEQTTPLEAGLGWVVDWSRRDYTGGETLHAQREAGSRRQLARLRLEGKGIPRHGCAILAGGNPAGEVTSGGFSPGLEAGIAMGYIEGETGLAALRAGEGLAVDIRGKAISTAAIKRSFVPAHTRQR